MSQHIVIIGNGIAGITTARQVRKLSDHRITVISGESEHFYSRTALMYIYMGHMRFEDTKPYEDWFWQKNRIEIKKAWVTSIDFSGKKLQLESGESLSYDKLVLATGSKPNKFGWPGQDLEGVQGLYSLQDLELMERNTRGISSGVIVGGGLIGIEVAEMLHSRGIHVTFLVREKSFWSNVLPGEESAMINSHILEHGIDLRLRTELVEILGDGRGKAKAVKTSEGEIIGCQFVALTAGVSPNVGFLKNTELNIEKGIVVDEQLASNIPDVYACGDCAQLKSPPPGRRAIEAVWYVGRLQGEALGKTLVGDLTGYQPGAWFNSAKFFDIEYQVYGNVPSKIDGGFSSIYWEHQDRRKSIRIVYDQNDIVVGFNLMGIRYRHSVCNTWIENQSKLRDVLSNLGAANFDPEFFDQFEKELLRQYNAVSNNPIELKRKRGLFRLTELFKS